MPSQHLRQAFFLIFPELILFYKMGIIMMSTVVVSLLWAMCFFTSLLAAIGPENDTGDLSKYVMLLLLQRKGECEGEQGGRGTAGQN